MARAEDKRRAAERREADERFFGAFEAYISECLKRPGFKLETESDMAVRFGVTRYKIRKALDRLNQSGAIVRKKHGGSVVRSVDQASLAATVDRELQLAGVSSADYFRMLEWLLTGILAELAEKPKCDGMQRVLEAVETLDDAARAGKGEEACVLGFVRAVLTARDNAFTVLIAGLGERLFERRENRPVDYRLAADLARQTAKDIRKEKPKKALQHFRELLALFFGNPV